MAEVAIPLVGLGLLYIAKKQDGGGDSNTINRNRIWLFDDSPTDIIGRIWIELLPPDQRPDSDFVLPNIQKELDKLNGYEARIKGNTYNTFIPGLIW